VTMPVVPPQAVQPVTAEEGVRMEAPPPEPQIQSTEQVNVIQQTDNRVIVTINNQTFVEHDEEERLRDERDEVIYERLPRERYRTTIVRPNGVRVVTIEDRYGNVLRRSRILPEGREVVLFFVPDETEVEREVVWEDPGEDLPEFELSIPEEEYIVETENSSPEQLYTALTAPPVETVERVYTLQDVRRSDRIRQKVRRIDIDSINFAFGSAEIDDAEIPKLESLARAIERALQENPAETFLIEGHTDAVGTDVANLGLSDRRAEAVATALTGAFGIPPENLVTQGYGEQELKVATEEPNRENRRVTVRRITPLVNPVASASR